MISEDDIRNAVIQAIIDTAGSNATDLVNSEDILQDLDLDSLDCIEIIMDIEDKLNIEIPETGYEKLPKTIDAWVEFVQEYV